MMLRWVMLDTTIAIASFRNDADIIINDIWIAAAALQNGLPVATHHTGHFGRVPGLNVEAW